jgi:hypothetical protein
VNQTSTPWGLAQDTNKIADGIVAVSTPRHGGIWLSEGRLEAFLAHPVGQRFRGFARLPWFEEDCDVAAVMLVFPECFDAAAIRAAVKSALSWGEYQPAVKAWLVSDAPEAVALVATKNAWETEHADRWETGGMGSVHGGEWSVSLYNVRSRERITVHMPYPTKQTYTTEELDAFRAQRTQ